MKIKQGPFGPKYSSPTNHPPSNPSKYPSGQFASWVLVGGMFSLDPEGKKGSSLGARSFAIRKSFVTGDNEN